MKNTYSISFLLAIFLAGFALNGSSAFAFSAINFWGNIELSDRYDSTVNAYQYQYQELGISKSRKILVLENHITIAYKNLAKARTKSKQNLGEKLIVRYGNTLDKELLRIKKLKAVTSVPTTRPATVNRPSATAPNPPVVSPTISSAFTPDNATWDHAAAADFLYYSDDFEWGNTSNGNVFHQSGFSAARCDIPLNTFIQLRYADTGLIVKANDRPNCSKHPDIVDLTRAGFTTLSPLSSGRLAGSVNSLGTVSNTLVKEYLQQDFFSGIGIQLDANLPNLYLPNETFRISGNTTNGEIETLIYIVTPSGKKISFGMDNRETSRFEYFYPLSEVGDYEFVVASGRSFSGVRALSFTVLDPKVLENKQYFVSAPIDTVTSLKSERREAGDLTALHIVNFENLPDTLFRSLTIESSSNKISRTSMWWVAFLPNELSGFKSGDIANVSVTGRTSSTRFSHDTYSVSASMFSKPMQLAPLYKPEHNLAFKSWVSGSKVYFALTEESSQKVSSTIDIITPSGKVDKISFDSDKIGSDGKLTSTKNAKFSYNMNESGVYLVEVNFDNGFAAIIEPVVYGNVLAILPNEYDFVNRDIETNASTAVKQTFDSINQVRKQAGLDALQIDPNLSKIAQFKAQDMSDNNYVGHVDSQGVFIRDTGKRIGVVITSSMGENVAGGTVSASFLQAGLSLSAWHRANMLGNWTKVGIGVVISGGKVHLSQVFGE